MILLTVDDPGRANAESLDPPAWEILKQDCPDEGWIVRIHGELICDADGKPSLFNPPYSISSREEFEAWRAQVFATIERLSGKAVKL